MESNCPIFKGCLEEKVNCVGDSYVNCKHFKDEFYSHMTDACGIAEDMEEITMLIDTIAGMSSSEVTSSLNGLRKQNLKPEFVKSWRELSEAYMYDRAVARLLHIDYANMPQQDIQKIKLYSYCMLLKNTSKKP